MNRRPGVTAVSGATRWIMSIGVMLCLIAAVGSCSAYTPRPVSDKTPILFVHGRGMHSSSFTTMIQYFRKIGYPDYCLRTIDLVPNDGPNIAAAEEQLAPEIERYVTEVNRIRKSRAEDAPAVTKIDIIAHSMGSVSSRWYAAKVRPDRVRVWISLAGPNHGSNVGCPGAAGSGKVELCPAYARTYEASPLQYMLNGGPNGDVDETPYGIGPDQQSRKRIIPTGDRRILYLTVRTEPDEWIDPVESTILDGTGGMSVSLPVGFPAVETTPGNFKMTNRVSHDGMLADEDVLRLLALLLLEADKQ